MRLATWYLVSKLNGKIKVVQMYTDNDATMVFHGRYVDLFAAIDKATELNKKRGV